MSIEIKQLIVKSTLVNETRDTDHRDSEINLERLKQQVIDECRELIEQSLEAQQER